MLRFMVALIGLISEAAYYLTIGMALGILVFSS